uniref:Uncharacterized protein n=1 Tax=Panagrellus redivivus TaxID=6233 RepID=A0A7E4VLE4_PANRE
MSSSGNDTSGSSNGTTPISDSTSSAIASRSQSRPSIASSTVSGTSTTCSCADRKCSQCTATLSSASTLTAGASASTYDASVARLNIPKNVISQLEKLVAAKPKERHSAEDPDAPTPGMRIRFYACVVTLITIGAATALANTVAISGGGVISSVFVLFLILFTVHWGLLYGGGLSRARKAYFDERNVLETYRIYDREFGHLFQKEPDTPGQAACCGASPPGAKPGEAVTAVGNDLIAQYKAAPQGKAEFASGNVQDHYGGMYDNIKRVNAELDLLAKANKANEEAGKAPSETNLPFVPVDLPLPGAKSPKSSSKSVSLKKKH